ncbi:hypothetical protein GY45DRAFT_1423503 [Cubamyces sp. BRFM 1775]|nr:hypothetical protein GY45DRAFT_1423503 [Cubamyces sp. BRFM 1775]
MFDPLSDTEEYDAYERQLGPNPSLSLIQHPKASGLRGILSETLPYCCGTLAPASDNLVLYYGKTEQAKRVDLLHMSATELDDLERYCDPATFGVAHKDVLDATFRKAGKLDRNHFALNFDIEHSGLLEAIRTSLFTGREQGRPIRAELYKLNVYGKGSFFKSHKDTPRSAGMFASLVLVFPIVHSGGTLVLQHGGYQWSVDASVLLSNADISMPRIAYIAFFSDVEHEVTRVTSGHRLTITYNLYYAFDDVSPNRIDVVQPQGANEFAVHENLASLLDDSTFLPNGGILGFGLRHLYPLPTSFDPQEDTTLETLKGKLKGVDAALFRACTELVSAPPLYTIFEAHSQVDAGGHRALVACPRVVKFHNHDTDDEPPVWEKLCRRWDGVLINFPPDELEKAEPGPVRHWTVHWVTPLSDVNRIKTRFAAYGNEPMMGYLYQRIAMLLQVGPPGHRKRAQA